MKLGIHLGNNGASATASTLATLAARAEELGFDSVWASDHVVVNCTRGAPLSAMLEAYEYVAREIRRVSTPADPAQSPRETVRSGYPVLSAIEHLDNPTLMMRSSSS